MKAYSTTRPSQPACSTFAPPPGRLLQRTCACGGTPGPTGECAECRRKRLLQPKLTINQPGDRYEQEADRVADTIMRMSTSEEVTPAGPSIHRIAREDAARGSARAAAPPLVDETLHASGQPLDAGTRTFMETRFGHDFSGVRIHTDAQAAASAQAVAARAYTVGRDVVFGAGEYAPDTTAGQRLLAHELVHTLQQGTMRGPMLQRQPTYTDCNDERKALVDAAVKQAKGFAQSAQEDLEQFILLSPTRNALQKAFGEDANKDAIAGVFKHMADTLESKTYICKTSCPKTQDKRNTCASGDMPGSVIRICPRFDSPGCGSTALTIIHEAAHNAGVHHGEAGPEDDAYRYETFIMELQAGLTPPSLSEKQEGTVSPDIGK